MDCRMNYLRVSKFNFERLYILCAWICHPSKKLWPFEFLESFHCSISNVSIDHAPESDVRVKSYDHLNNSRDSIVHVRASRYMMLLNRTSERKVMTILISLALPFFNCECLDISWASIVHPCQKLWSFEFEQSFSVQFRPCRYIMCLNWTSKWKVMSIWISREHSLFNF